MQAEGEHANSTRRDLLVGTSTHRRDYYCKHNLFTNGRLTFKTDFNLLITKTGQTDTCTVYLLTYHILHYCTVSADMKRTQSQWFI